MTNLKLNKKVIWAILNSELLSYYYGIKNESKHMAGGYFGMDIPSIESIPFKVPTEQVQKEIQLLVDKNDYEAIEKIVYELYEISSEEILIIKENL